MIQKKLRFFALVFTSFIFLSCTSIQKTAMNSLASNLSGADKRGKALNKKSNENLMLPLTGETDSILMADFFPTALKLYEILHAQNPEHQGLSLMTASLSVMYANAFIQHKAEMLPQEAYLLQNAEFQRAKMHYLRAYDTKEEFVDAMVNWIQNPDEQNALMPGAVKRFKVMPKLPLPTEDLEKIASYIYDNNIEEPVWMEEHMKGKKGRM